MPAYVYISGPLQAARDLTAARRFYEQLGAVCESQGWPVYLPHQQTDPEHNPDADPALVFATDYDRVAEASLIIAHIGIASSGVGAELGIAYERKIPVVALHARAERPSRFLLGLVLAAGFPLLVYEGADDAAEKLAAWLAMATHQASTKTR